jgi:transcriptional regulator with XRE-family HTH domain
METVTLGSFIRDRRESLGKTLRGLAAELDIAAPYLHDIEKGQTALPLRSCFPHLSKHFCSPQWMK